MWCLRGAHAHGHLGGHHHGGPAGRGGLHGIVLCGFAPALQLLLRLAPRQPQPLSFDDELAVQLLGGLICGAARGEGDKRAHLGLHLFDGHNLPKCIKVVAQVLLRNVGGHAAHKPAARAHVGHGQAYVQGCPGMTRMCALLFRHQSARCAAEVHNAHSCHPYVSVTNTFTSVQKNEHQAAAATHRVAMDMSSGGSREGISPSLRIILLATGSLMP